MGSILAHEVEVDGHVALIGILTLVLFWQIARFQKAKQP